MRRIAIPLIILMTAAAIFLVTGPRVAVDTTIRFDEAMIGDDPAAYLAGSEAQLSDIRPGLEKEIIWHDPEKRQKTPLAVLYLHGFSASKGEVRPLPDLVAAHFGANLYYARLTGHGRSEAAMGEASVNAWINDLAEALAIGRSIGERVILMATSTGGTLAAWGATEPGLMRNVSGLVLLSPNFGIQAAGTSLLLMPWGETVARLVLGEERGSEPEGEASRKYWTWRYPVKALLPLAAMTQLAQERSYADVTIPALFILSDEDHVVLPQETRRIAAGWGAPHRIIAIEQSDDPGMHVIAGDARSPSTTEAIAADIIGWVEALGAP